MQKTLIRFAVIASLAIGTVSFNSLIATAAPSLATSLGTKPALVQNAPIEQARYRGRGGGRYAYGSPRGRGYGYNRGRNRGIGLGVGVGAAILGGVIISEAARAERRRSSNAYDRCADTYRSFEPSTGYYTGYDGVRRLCPYLD